MRPARYDFELPQGSQWDPVFTFKNADGSLWDLTGYEARMSFRWSLEDAAAVLALTSNPAAGITMGGALGTVSPVITAAQSGGLSVPATNVYPQSRDLYYDLELVDSGGVPKRYMYGIAKVTREVTR